MKEEELVLVAETDQLALERDVMMLVLGLRNALRQIQIGFVSAADS